MLRLDAVYAPVSGDLMILGDIPTSLPRILLPAVSKSDQSHSDARTAVLNIVGFLILIFVLGYGIVNSRAHWLFPRNTAGALSLKILDRKRRHAVKFRMMNRS